VNWRVVRLLACLVFLVGCAGTETGNPSFDGTMGYDAYSSALERVALRGEPSPSSDSAPVRVESAWLVLGNVSFLGADECDGKGELGHAKGLGAGDHVGSQAPTTPFELSPAKLCGVRLPLETRSDVSGAAPPELAGHSILITGTRDDLPFRIASAARPDVLLTAAKDVELDAAHSSVLIGFDVAAWLDGIDWSGVTMDDDETLTIDSEHNAAQLTLFDTRIAAGIALFRDANGDGLLDADSEPVARASE
jgi:hypothetical protein